ncbi:MAG: hypothetical protein OXP36_13425 [Gammaproteobacteria bacterium]|nr:hypothetical protein [Gammaproteobacteria bacterium]
MRRRRMMVQRDLFRTDDPAISMSAELREDLIDLVSALIQEVMASPNKAEEGGDHDPSHR